MRSLVNAWRSMMKPWLWKCSMSAAVISFVPSSRRRPWPQVVPVPGQPLIIRPESGNASIAAAWQKAEFFTASRAALRVARGPVARGR